VPKLGHLAICVGTSVRRRWGNFIAWNLIESYNDYSMVGLVSALFVHFDNSSLIELEGRAVGVEGDRERLLHQSILHLIYVTADLPPLFDVTHNVGLNVLASAWYAASTRSVWVVLLEDGTMVPLELPRVIHPGAITAPALVVNRA